MSEVPERLTGAAREAARASLVGWVEVPGRDAWSRAWSFPDFAEAFAWLTRVAAEAERVQHHPVCTVSWGRLEVELSTHEVGGVSSRDVELARLIEGLASRSLGAAMGRPIADR
jgi:4a-hydroxytetrahydrobiopterin dehydratase